MEKFSAQQPQQQLEQEETIDLLEVFHVLWHKAWLLALSLVAGAVILALVTALFITPQYEATSTIYILSRSTSITSLADLQIGSSLAADFQIIATTREVVQSVMDRFGMTDTTYEEFVETIQVVNPTDSHMLQITVTHPDQQLVAQLSNALADELRDRIADVMSTDTPSTVERAVTPLEPSSPNLFLNTALGGLAAFVVAAAVVLVRHFLDDTIKDEQDVERYLRINVLAAIPLERVNNKRKGGRMEPPRQEPEQEYYEEEEEDEYAGDDEDEETSYDGDDAAQ